MYVTVSPGDLAYLGWQATCRDLLKLHRAVTSATRQLWHSYITVAKWRVLLKSRYSEFILFRYGGQTGFSDFA